MEERLVELDWIRIGEGRRLVDDAAVDRLAASIAEIGLLERIGVMPDGTLIWGNYRFHAYRKLGLKQIPALILDLDDVRAKLMEIDENLCRTDLTPVEKSIAMTERKEIYLKLHPETDHGANRPIDARWNKSPDYQDSYRHPSFVADTAQKTGKSPKTIEMYVRVGNSFTSDELKKLTEAEMPINHLDKLASLRHPERYPEKVAAVLAAPVEQMRVLADELMALKEEGRTSRGRANRDRQEREASLARQTEEQRRARLEAGEMMQVERLVERIERLTFPACLERVLEAVQQRLKTVEGEGNVTFSGDSRYVADARAGAVLAD